MRVMLSGVRCPHQYPGGSCRTFRDPVGPHEAKMASCACENRPACRFAGINLALIGTHTSGITPRRCFIYDPSTTRGSLIPRSLSGRAINEVRYQQLNFRTLRNLMRSVPGHTVGIPRLSAEVICRREVRIFMRSHLGAYLVSSEGSISSVFPLCSEVSPSSSFSGSSLGQVRLMQGAFYRWFFCDYVRVDARLSCGHHIHELISCISLIHARGSLVWFARGRHPCSLPTAST